MERIRIDVWVDSGSVTVRAEDLKTFRIVEEEAVIYPGSGSEGYDTMRCIERAVAGWLPEDADE